MRIAYLCEAVRTPIGRHGGSLASVRPDDLGAVSLRALIARHPSLDWGALDDVVFGCANQAGEDNRNIARMSLLLAGLPEHVAGVTVNRLCGSGLDAVAIASRMITAGEADLVVAGGVESMTRAPFVLSKAEAAYARDAQLYDTTIGWRFVNPAMQLRYGVDSMPETAESVAAECGISREDQDAFALRSQQKALAARAKGAFAREIVPVTIVSRKGASVTVDVDEHPRETSLEALSRLPTPFRAGGTVTAGNSSGINDGACVVLLASEAGVSRHGLNPLARVVGAAVAGVAPRLMGLGPVPATQKLLARLDLRIGDIELIELNEAFAAQALAVLRQLGVSDDAEHVNPQGGAIALGHPLGMSGARLVATAALQMHRGGARRALCSMCIGVGQGISLLLERA